MHRIPNTAEPSLMRDGPNDPIIVVPYVDGMLRPETEHAVSQWGGRYTLYPLDSADPYAYGALLASLWNGGGDLVWIEQDMVPAPGDILGLLQCPEPWCTHRYHVGEGRLTYGLGFCKFGSGVQFALPGVGRYAATHQATGGAAMPWQGLNESVERALTRRGINPHIHLGLIEHLHYPVTHDGA